MRSKFLTLFHTKKVPEKSFLVPAAATTREYSRIPFYMSSNGIELKKKLTIIIFHRQTHVRGFYNKWYALSDEVKDS